jgi:hypothetical protein
MLDVKIAQRTRHIYPRCIHSLSIFDVKGACRPFTPQAKPRSDFPGLLGNVNQTDGIFLMVRTYIANLFPIKTKAVRGMSYKAYQPVLKVVPLRYLGNITGKAQAQDAVQLTMENTWADYKLDKLG